MERQADYVRHFRKGPDGDHATRIIGELVEAGRTLTSPGRRAEYDKGLGRAGAATVGLGAVNGTRGRRAGRFARSLAYVGFTLAACVASAVAGARLAPRPPAVARGSLAPPVKAAPQPVVVAPPGPLRRGIVHMDALGLGVIQERHGRPTP